MADYARHIGYASVGQVVPAHNEMDVIQRMHKVGRKYSARFIPIHAKEG